ncbi:ankyrin repeat domain-containing protein [Verrucomicrobia bacterium]|nr:ankyrin repeat domain-containing protein [Verrucomicrobiota bacterium]
MKHLLLTTIAVASLLAATGFAEPIHNAAFSGNIEAVKQRIAAGADVNAMNEYGWTPLHEAVTGGHKDIADLLISKGAEVNAKEAKNRITPLHWAAWRGRKEIAELLITKAADVNVKNKDGGTPLHNAAWKGHVEIANLLIVKNADVTAKDVEGQTPLDWAEEEKHKEIVDLLRKHGGKRGEELQPPSQLLPIPDNLVVLTFDDGNKSDFANVPKVLKKHGFGATFYVTEGLGFLKNPQNYLSWEQIRQLHEMGYEIGNHTQHHRNVSHLKSEELAASLAHIDKRCAENKITKPVTFCYPGFHNNHASVKVLEKHGFLFARRGVGPEYKDPGKGARGPAYDPKVDDPLLVPTTGYAGPDWKMKDLKWAIDQAEDGKITVLCFHGIPAIEHPWVNTDLKDFEMYMQYLKDEGCTVIAMRDLAKYVNPNHRPHKADPYQPVRKRVAEMKRKASKKE